MEAFNARFLLSAILTFLSTRHWKAFCSLLAYTNAACTYADVLVPKAVLVTFPLEYCWCSPRWCWRQAGKELKLIPVLPLQWWFSPRVAPAAGKDLSVLLAVDVSRPLCKHSSLCTAESRSHVKWGSSVLRRRSRKGELLLLHLISLKNTIRISSRL